MPWMDPARFPAVIHSLTNWTAKRRERRRMADGATAAAPAGRPSAAASSLLLCVKVAHSHVIIFGFRGPAINDVHTRGEGVMQKQM